MKHTAITFGDGKQAYVVNIPETAMDDEMPTAHRVIIELAKERDQLKKDVESLQHIQGWDIYVKPIPTHRFTVKGIITKITKGIPKIFNID
jgi:predicted extracellular nuclease